MKDEIAGAVGVAMIVAVMRLWRRIGRERRPRHRRQSKQLVGVFFLLLWTYTCTPSIRDVTIAYINRPIRPMSPELSRAEPDVASTPTPIEKDTAVIDRSPEIHWQSTDTTGVSVSSSGVVTALKSGTFHIIATSAAGLADTGFVVVVSPGT